MLAGDSVTEAWLETVSAPKHAVHEAHGLARSNLVPAEADPTVWVARESHVRRWPNQDAVVRGAALGQADLADAGLDQKPLFEGEAADLNFLVRVQVEDASFVDRVAQPGTLARMRRLLPSIRAAG